MFLNDYFNFHICLSIYPSFCVRKLTPVSAVVSQYVTNKSFLACAKNEKCAFLVTPRPFWSMRQGEAKINALQYWARWNKAWYNETHFIVSLPPQSRSKAVLCISTRRRYLRSGYFLVYNEITRCTIISLIPFIVEIHYLHIRRPVIIVYLWPDKKSILQFKIHCLRIRITKFTYFCNLESYQLVCQITTNLYYFLEASIIYLQGGPELLVLKQEAF